MTVSLSLENDGERPWTNAEAVAYLRSCAGIDPLLAALPQEEIDWIVERGSVRQLNAGDAIHSKHAPSDSLYRVLSGAVRISSVSAQGREAIFNYYGRDEWFGQIGLIDGGPRAHDIRACGPCVLYTLARRDVQALLERHPALYREFALLLCAVIRYSFALVEDHALLSLSARLAKHLVTLVDAYGADHPAGRIIDLHLPQEDLSMLLGSSRQTMNRKLAEWSRLGWIKVQYSQIVVVNREALVQLYA
jgi:CRP/FNR family cyclic AMP-dependent transcriptional regulator